jgi:hypothetical protein
MVNFPLGQESIVSPSQVLPAKLLQSLTLRGILRGVLLAFFPWAPAYLFERADFWFGQTNNGYWYYLFSSTRLEAFVISFALGGILVAYLLRPRWAVIQVLLSASLVYVLFYFACPTYMVGPVWKSECYSFGPDGLAGVRLCTMMFSFGALPAIVRASYKEGKLNKRLRPWIALFGAFITSVVTTWFPLTAWFSGVTYLAPLVPFQAVLLFGVSEIAVGIQAAKISRSILVATVSGATSALLLSGFLWPLLCPSCDRSLLFLTVPSWGFFALIGGILELGLPRKLSVGPLRHFSPRLEDIRRVGIAVVLLFSLWTLVSFDLWDPSVLYATSISPGPGQLTLGAPSYPYVAGYYNSTQYRICCVQIGVSFTKVDLKALAPNNFLMAGMGVQSPNCCIDGWDFGWRADLFVLPNGTRMVSGSSWETCDGNANCGGIFWEHLRYHAQRIISPTNTSTPVYLRMMWQYDQPNWHADWYYNYTGQPWTKFGSFVPDFREGHYFDIGVVGGGNYPWAYAFFYQFGVASKTPVPGWSAQLLYPSFVHPDGSWRLMERANIIQGWHSYWKANYRWGGQPYNEVSALANANDETIPLGVLQLSYIGTGSLKDKTVLW